MIAVHRLGGAPDQSSTLLPISAPEISEGCRKVRRPRRPYGSGTFERSNSAGELDGTAGNYKVLRGHPHARCAFVVATAAHGVHSSALTRLPCHSNRSAGHGLTRTAPRANAARIVVVSIDCLALVGHPRRNSPGYSNPSRWWRMRSTLTPTFLTTAFENAIVLIGGHRPVGNAEQLLRELEPACHVRRLSGR